MPRFKIKAIDTSMGIDGESILQACADTTKKWLVRHRKSPDRTERGLLLAKFASLAIHALVSRLIDVERRLASIEHVKVSKSLDIEAFDSLTELVERVEKLEASVIELGDRAFDYRGYWSGGMKAKRNEAYTHDGSIWLAHRSTDDTPSKASPAWSIICRKGRDGRDGKDAA